MFSHLFSLRLKVKSSINTSNLAVEKGTWGILTSQLTFHIRTPKIVRWLLFPNPKGKTQNSFSFLVAGVKVQFVPRWRVEIMCFFPGVWSTVAKV